MKKSINLNNSSKGKGIVERNHTVGTQRNIDKAQNVIIFPNTLGSDLYIDSDDRCDDCSVSLAIYNNTNNLINAQTSRIGLKFVDMYCNIPNSNERNNVYILEVDGNPPVSFTMPIKNYVDVVDLHADLKLKMDLAVAGFTITFTQKSDNTTTMTGNIGFRFNTCNGITFGNNLHGIPYTTGFTTSIKIISKLYYTRYIDILLTELVDAKVLSHKFSDNKRFNTSNHLTRLYIPFANDSAGTVGKQLTNFQRENVNINYYPFRHRDVVEFKISLVDEFEEPLYYGSQIINTTDPISTLNTELPYLKYNFVLSIIG